MKRSYVENSLAQELPNLLAALNQELEIGEYQDYAFSRMAWAIVEFLDCHDLMSAPRRQFWNTDKDGNLQQHHKNGDYVNEWERE